MVCGVDIKVPKIPNLKEGSTHECEIVVMVLTANCKNRALDLKVVDSSSRYGWVKLFGGKVC